MSIEDLQSSSNEGEGKMTETNSTEEKATKPKARQQNVNKQVECKVCLRKMRSDTVKRHMKTHQKRANEEKMSEEMEQRKKSRESRDELENMIRRILREELSKENTKSMMKKSEMMTKSQFQFTSFITGYYFYRHKWTPYIGQELTTMCEMDNSYDKFAVSVY